MTLDEVFRGRVPTPPEKLARMLRDVLYWAQAEVAAADREDEDALSAEQEAAPRKRARKRKGA